MIVEEIVKKKFAKILKGFKDWQVKKGYLKIKI